MNSIEVVLQSRTRSSYGHKTGLLHPYNESNKYFRSLYAQFSIRVEVTDEEITATGFEVGSYYSECAITANFVSPVETIAGSADVVFNWRLFTNYWSGRPGVYPGDPPSDQSDSGGQTDVPPWVRPNDDANDCWTAEQILGVSAVGQPLRFTYSPPSPQVPFAGVVTSDYEGADVGAVVIPPLAFRRYTVTGGEVWTRDSNNDDTWSHELDTVMSAETGSVYIKAFRRIEGVNIVTMDNEFTTAELKATVRAALATGEWVDGGQCAFELLDDYEYEYTVQDVDFRFVYDYTKQVRIGYRINVGDQQGALQFVESPGGQIFTIPAEGGLYRCPELVSATECL